MFKSTSLPFLLAALTGAAAWKDQCEQFTVKSLEGVQLVKAVYYDAGALVNLTTPLQSITTSQLPAFCRLQLNLTTNAVTGKAAYSELWLPDGWNSRTLGFGNGGWSGGVPVNDLGLNGVAQGYASFGTNTGHDSPSRSGTWGGPRNDDAIIDFAYRALHVTTVVSKQLVAQYYGYPHTKSYYLACSTGGRQGIKAMASFPEDYDGVVIGSPANAMARLQPWSIHQGLNVQPVNSSRWITTDLWSVIHKEALSQCDELDGVKDGVISNPAVCNFQPELLTCRQGSNTGECLNLDQLDALRKLYSDYLDADQNWIFSGYVPGGELGYPTGLATAQPFQISTDYYKYFVLNDTNWDFNTLNASTIDLGIELNPGQMDTNVPDLTAFFARGGKVIQYVGWNDQLISPGNSIKWYQDVYAYTLANSNLNPEEHFKLITVPAMTHCSGGEGAWVFGGSGQRSTSPPRQPLQPGPEYDIQAAMVAWLENDRTVDHIISTKYLNDDASAGVSFTRKLCPYPQQAVYQGGDQNTEASFVCK
ncbi:hypothetical protein NliqN6_5510 [Naganishia liquefaciens]|uniref:Carboxylic ester hydrolase n=1 Tax=Naganishia liquefaciens TaxID=104408 RepID=A0A8H3YH89_9TREE|nr:hypothetical protein NliqN6_5510 [Naganishia liquefaciens]